MRTTQARAFVLTCSRAPALNRLHENFPPVWSPLIRMIPSLWRKEPPAGSSSRDGDVSCLSTKLKVTLTQSNLTCGVKASDVEHRAEYEKNWAMVLDGLAKAVG